MNHNCVPNIRYSYGRDQIMTCKASKLIKKGEQIFNSYTKILWGTINRRMHLYYSKNFLCKCERCMEPTEFGKINKKITLKVIKNSSTGSYVSAINCIRIECPGKMLIIEPLVMTSPWKCDTCGLNLSNLKVTKIHDIISKQVHAFHV